MKFGRVQSASAPHQRLCRLNDAVDTCHAGPVEPRQGARNSGSFGSCRREGEGPHVAVAVPQICFCDPSLVVKYFAFSEAGKSGIIYTAIFFTARLSSEWQERFLGLPVPIMPLRRRKLLQSRSNFCDDYENKQDRAGAYARIDVSTFFLPLPFPFPLLSFSSPFPPYLFSSSIP